MSDATSVDLFADVAPETEGTPVVAESDAETATAPTETGAEETPETPIETVSSVPDGAMSVTDFAAHMTQQMMVARIKAGEEVSGGDYVVPQAVYQTVKASKDRIPHILVKAEGDAEARVYIKTDEAVTWWNARRDRLATRGTGASRASSRTVEDNLTLLGGAVEKHLYALSRQEMWNTRVTQAENLIDKYKGFLKDGNADPDAVEKSISDATDAFNAAQAAKAVEKAKKDKADGANATPDATPATDASDNE